MALPIFFLFFFFNDTATTEIYTLSLHDALPISSKELRSPDATLADANWIQDAELVPVEIKQEFNHIDKQLIKRKVYLEKRKQLYGWSRRAEAVHSSTTTSPPNKMATIRVGDEYYSIRR